MPQARPLEAAARLYRDFIARAGASPEFAHAVKRAKERSQDITDTVKFIREGQTARRTAAAEAKKRKAQAKAKSKAKPKAKKPADKKKKK